MKRHFNYTNRQRIPREQLTFAWLESGDGILKFSAEIKLNLPIPIQPNAEVIVEAHSGPVVMRFPWGTIEKLQVPADTSLTDFPPGLKPLFRVKIIDATDGKQRILARADDISPLSQQEAKSGKRSIFPVETLDLGSLIWNVRFEGTKAILQLNANIKEPRDISTLAKEADFISLVYPAAIHRVLHYLLLGPERENVEADNDWLLFGATLSERHAPNAEDYDMESDDFRTDTEEWISDVVKGFCAKQGVVEAYVQFRKEVEA